MAEKDSYKVLKKKIRKVDRLMQKLKLHDKEKTKEYRAYGRKLESYQKQIEKTSEYKEEKLKNALNDLHNSLHSLGDLSLENGKDDGDDDNKSTSSGSSASSSSSSSSEESVDYELTLKKYDKVSGLLKELERDHGIEEAQTRSDYKKYVGKQKEYLHLLNKTEQWAEESYRREEKEALARARIQAEEEQKQLLAEHEKAVQAAREAARAEIEKEKEKTLAKLRAERAKREELEKARDVAYEEAGRIAQKAIMKESEHLVEETKKREQDYAHLLKEQEDRGMIRIIRKWVLLPATNRFLWCTKQYN